MMHRLTVGLRLVLLLVLFAAVGCGGSEPEQAEVIDAAPESGEPTGPVVPQAGIVRIRVVSRETLPSLEPATPTPMTPQEMRSAVDIGLKMLMESSEEIVVKPLPGTDLVRYWLVRSETLDEASAVVEAERLAEAFLASAESRFQDRIQVELMGLTNQLDAASARRAEMQTTLRDYLDINRGRAGTEDSRLRQAELERELQRTNERVGQMQDLQEQLQRVKRRGQPWYRRIE